MRQSVAAQKASPRSFRRRQKTTIRFRLFVSGTNRRACAGSPRLQEFFHAMVEGRRSFRTRFSLAPALLCRVSIFLADRTALSTLALQAACAFNFDKPRCMRPILLLIQCLQANGIFGQRSVVSTTSFIEHGGIAHALHVLIAKLNEDDAKAKQFGTQ